MEGIYLLCIIILSAVSLVTLTTQFPVVGGILIGILFVVAIMIGELIFGAD
jgi:hypothetical protein